MQIVRTRWISGEKTQGCEKAPVELLKELKEIKSKEDGQAIEFEKLNLEEIHVDLKNKEEADYLIYKNSIEIFEKNNKAFFIGGDHSIDYSIVRAFNKTQTNSLVIVFDAHSDCFESGKIPNNRQWIRKLAEENFGNMLLISTRNLNQEEIYFLKEKRISIIKMNVITEEIAGICDMVMERARLAGGFYISIDMDCLDPCFAPGGIDLEAGGLTSRDLIYFLKRLSLLGNFRGASITEINPDKDINRITLKLGARLLAEMI